MSPAWIALGLTAAGIAALALAAPRATAAENEPQGHRSWQLWECEPGKECRMRGKPLGKTACLLDLTDLSMKSPRGVRLACVSVEHVNLKRPN